MKKHFPEVKAALAGAAVFVALPAFAQSTVTLYGVVDNGIGYQSSATTLGSTSGGRSAVKMLTGVWLGSRFGLTGAEDLGGGTKAIFTLEQGFSPANGAMATSGLMFSRQAFVGMTNDRYGTLTAGRQYASYVQMLLPYSPVNWLTGFFGAHPGDLDGLDTIYRANNTLVYTSPKLYGFKFSGSYSLAGVPGSINRGSTWATGIQYSQGPLGFAVGFSRINNSTSGGGPFGVDSTTSNAGAQAGVSAVTNGYQTAQAQQRFAVGAGYTFNSQFDITATYTNVQYIPGVGSSFRDQAVWNTGGVVLHWKPAAAWDFATGYSYTRASRANGITSAAQYQQFNLSQYYALSKRTGLYAVEAYQRANGKTLGTDGKSIINATATIGDGFNSTPSSSPSMVGLAVGIVHRF
ncbi:porin [Paraburkholderia caballeronis]|uniref:Outer membrane protein (Porin) n=1 Tax=Paraburkholderia caballeronis TaxID=416943 RepID=A0A1H7JC81_9BURK|nr:porin [Paraburkholderia caballeronis]PXW27490.1 putative porin [Paraburkholderia caballeronis]PXX02964.1 putative porin [Paraburkholderia caballeronis]RAK03689.1 putative porin [Paraburkholderia caballeronis]SEC25687.1 Outer membrane protein (porin) [Paraburkholderia caballeronis]SEK71984.1 Outer membrane protein (porin) [Paraburkholderia caballeronis]